MSNAASRTSVAESDRLWVALSDTLRARLERCDPSLMGVYAEQLVADELGGHLAEDGWGSTDVHWHPEESGLAEPIGIQVKAARLHRTFNRGLVRSVSFSTAASKPLSDVHSKTPGSLPTRAPVWVFALHTATDYRKGWRFFAVPGRLLDLLDKNSISPNSLITRGFWPIGSDGLRRAVISAFEQNRTADNFTIDTIRCPKCGLTVDTPQKMAAHQASRHHTLSIRELKDPELLARLQKELERS